MNLMFLQGKICVLARVASHLQSICCLNSAFLRSILIAKIISPVIFDTSVIQMVKCYFIDEKFVYQSFYDALFTFSYFLLQGKVLCFAHVNKSLTRCLFVKSVWSTLSKKFYPWLFYDSNCSFKAVKCSFFNQIIVHQSFYGAPLTFNYVLLQGKFLCFGMRRQVACEMFV